jgi:hypothetical protein
MKYLRSASRLEVERRQSGGGARMPIMSLSVDSSPPTLGGARQITHPHQPLYCILELSIVKGRKDKVIALLS